MRVNHAGEVAAQALYHAQALFARNAKVRDFMLHAAREETDHLAWCETRLKELGARPSVEAMCHDEVGHGREAQSAGAASLPGPVRELMRRTARIMTHTSYRL